MNKRGRVLRDTKNGTGLISAEGSQYEFKLEGVWKSDVAPAVDMLVEFELNTFNQIVCVTAISDSQLAKEQADKALKLAKEKGGAAFDEAVSRVGKPVLIATSLVAISWFFLSAITVQASQDLAIKITLWKTLAILNASGGDILQTLQGSGDDGAGIYGFLAILALIGPFISQFWKDAKAHFGNCLPLLMMLFVAITLYMGVQDSIHASQQAMSAMGSGEIGKMMSNMANQMMKSAMQAIHVGVGVYVATAASVYLAFVGVKKYLVAKA